MLIPSTLLQNLCSLAATPALPAAEYPCPAGGRNSLGAGRIPGLWARGKHAGG